VRISGLNVHLEVDESAPNTVPQLSRALIQRMLSVPILRDAAIIWSALYGLEGGKSHA
jgi:hypothetical protein